jgi:hypothetical protein
MVKLLNKYKLVAGKILTTIALPFNAMCFLMKLYFSLINILYFGNIFRRISPRNSWKCGAKEN